MDEELPAQEGQPEILSDDDVYGIAKRELDAAELTDGDDTLNNRRRALNYMYGDMRDTQAKEGRSRVMTRTLRDTVGWMLPGIMRVFFSSDNIAAVNPAGPEDEAQAQQQADGLNHVFQHDCKGYVHMQSAFHDALVLRTGVVKFWWERKIKRSLHRSTGLDDMALAALMAERENVITAITETQEQADTGMAEGQQFSPVPLKLYDVEYRRDKVEARPVIMAVPPEEYRINIDARSVEEARFLAHVCTKKRGDLVALGYDKQTVDDIPKSSTFIDVNGLRNERDLQAFGGVNQTDSGAADRWAEWVDVAEC